ncbi:3-hydroxyacyl-ACP dehydratase FabZ family protein [Robiginitalea sp. IMCC43444]|uniref:3-hydroxyacyl-ACP dehydratase FabZ family protein n=1 Tax=Robiginitalea sp. IMCC43444 TaxID=3459121 RepID=UPI004043939A
MYTDADRLLEKLPYGESFLFVDALPELTPERIVGQYRFPSDSWYYRGHFKDRPVTPGVILTECCAQIALVCHGIYLLEESGNPYKGEDIIAFSETQMQFLKAVFPGETVRVIGEKQYFRFGKLKSSVKMVNSEDELLCRGTLSGMIIQESR